MAVKECLNQIGHQITVNAAMDREPKLPLFSNDEDIRSFACIGGRLVSTSGSVASVWSERNRRGCGRRLLFRLGLVDRPILACVKNDVQLKPERLADEDERLNR